MENSFERRLQKGNWWENGNECLNLHDINKPPQYYTGTDKEWIEEITTYIYLYPVEWQTIFEQYKSLSKKGLALQFYRNEEGYLRRVGIDKVYLKVTAESKLLSKETLNNIGRTLLEHAEELFYSYLEYSNMDGRDNLHWSGSMKKKFQKIIEEENLSVMLTDTVEEASFKGNELYYDLLNDLYIIL